MTVTRSWKLHDSVHPVVIRVRQIIINRVSLDSTQTRRAQVGDVYPQDGPEQMVAEVRRHGWTFPYLYDETQDVARAFSAACTPDTSVFEGGRRLVYRGQLDDSRPRNDLPVTAADVRAAVDAVLAGRPVDPDQRPSIGCGIKWR